MIDTFLDIEKELNINYEQSDDTLANWYQSIKNISFNKLSIEDICKCIRQKLFLKYLLPTVIVHLKTDINIGDLYDGEMIASLNTVDNVIWKENEEEAKQIKDIITKSIVDIDDDIKNDASSLLSKINNSI